MDFTGHFVREISDMNRGAGLYPSHRELGANPSGGGSCVVPKC